MTEYSSNDNINYIIMIIKQKVNEKNKNKKILGGKRFSSILVVGGHKEWRKIILKWVKS